MITIFAGALLMAASAYTGLAIKRIYKIRHETYMVFVQLCDALYRQINFLKTPLKDVLEAFCNNKKGLPYDLIKKYIIGLQSGYINVTEVENHLKNIYLSTDDTKEIAEFLFSLGKNDFDLELKNILSCKLRFQSLESVAMDNLEKKGGMYYKLSVLLGVALMVIVV